MKIKDIVAYNRAGVNEDGEAYKVTQNDPKIGLTLAKPDGTQLILPPEKVASVMADPNNPDRFTMNPDAVADTQTDPNKPMGPEVGKEVEIAAAEDIGGDPTDDFIKDVSVKPHVDGSYNYEAQDDSFAMSPEDFMKGLAEIQDELSKVSPIESQEMFGAQSEYPYHDWKTEPSGAGIITRLQDSRRDRPNLRQQLDNLGESFVSDLRNTVRESGATPRFSISAPDTKEFKQWFGDSKVVNSDGSPKVYYHGTARNITEFKPKQEIDLGAEKMIAAQNDIEKIAVEVKSFIQSSIVYDFHAALGQYLNYLLGLKKQDPDRTLFLAVPLRAQVLFDEMGLILESIETYGVKMIVYEEKTKTIISWKR
jgi:hypothetical protein